MLKGQKKIARDLRINELIRIREVRVIDDEGQQLGVMPTAKRIVDMGVIARQTRTQIGDFILGADLHDASEVLFFNEEMCRDQYDSGDPRITQRAGMDRGD